MLLGLLWFNKETPPRDEINYSFFREQLDKNNIKEVEFIDTPPGRSASSATPPKVTVDQAARAAKEPKPSRRRSSPISPSILPPLVGEELDKELLRQRRRHQRRAHAATTSAWCC